MYHHGDSTKGMTKQVLVAAYKAGEVDMSDDGLVVHYGGMPYDHNKLPKAAEAELQAAVKKAGGWKKVVAKALDGWSDLCVSDGMIYTGSL